MISFKSFIKAIHEAILSANDAVMEKNTGLLDKYFYDDSNQEDTLSNLNEAISTSHHLINKPNNLSKEDISSAKAALEKAKSSLENHDFSPDTNSSKLPGTLTPKSVVVEYPNHTDKGIELIDVHVPLITLVPLSMSQVEKATIKANFDMQVVDDELQLSFSNKGDRRRSKWTRGTLEITIAPHETSDGLKQLVEGYEKALKSQIPG